MKTRQLAECGCVVVCQGKDCKKAGAGKLRKALEKTAGEAGAKVMVLKSRCMGRCGRAPVVAAWPGGIAFLEAEPGDAAEILVAAGVKMKKKCGKKKAEKKEKPAKDVAVAKAAKTAKDKPGKPPKQKRQDKEKIVPPEVDPRPPEGQGYAE